jgi:integrase
VAGVYKRASDRARGKSGKWTAWFLGEDGRKHERAAFPDRARSLELAQHLEAEARRVREGLAAPGDRARREAAARPVAEHVEDYRRDLLARGDRPKHAAHVAGAVRRVLADAAIGSVADLAPDRLRAALGRLRAVRSPRTANHALGAVKAFARWLADSNRIEVPPRGLLALKPYNEDVDRRRVRRALTREELARLLAAAEAGPPVVTRRDPRSKSVIGTLTGPERAALYRIAMGTGFRANEIRTLTPERFALEGDGPTITVPACYSKRGRDDVQPIPRALAAALRPWLATRPPGVPVLAVPARTAELLRRDLAAAGIPARDAAGRVLDFHALRHSYITHLIAGGVNPKVVQRLARHSTITLTLDKYTHVDDEDMRDALEEDGTR